MRINGLDDIGHKIKVRFMLNGLVRYLGETKRSLKIESKKVKELNSHVAMLKEELVFSESRVKDLTKQLTDIQINYMQVNTDYFNLCKLVEHKDFVIQTITQKYDNSCADLLASKVLRGLAASELADVVTEHTKYLQSVNSNLNYMDSKIVSLTETIRLKELKIKFLTSGLSRW